LRVKLHFLPRIIFKHDESAISKHALRPLIRFLMRVPKSAAHASQCGAAGGLLPCLSRRFGKSFLASMAGFLEASGSATGNRAKSSRPQKLPVFRAGIQNRVCRKAVDPDATL